MENREAVTQRIFQKIFQSHHSFFEYMRAQLGDTDAHPRQAPILCRLMSHDDVSQADICRELGVGAATVAVSVARLEKLGYLQRERNERNRRANMLRLTESGRTVATRLEQVMRGAQEMALDGFSTEELECLYGFCERIMENLKKQGNGE